MKKLLSLLCIAALAAAIFCIVPIKASAETSGSLDGNVSYSYNTGTKVLTISGTGATKDYENAAASPIYSDSTIRGNCLEIVVEEGVTRLGNYCCSNLTKVTRITLPSTLESLGNYVFNRCDMLESVNLPEGLTAIGNNAFSAGNAGSKATSLTLPSTLESIGASAFKNWQHVTQLNIPGSVKTIGSFAFDSWYALTSLTLNEGLETIDQECFNFAQITEVTLPASLTDAGFYFFKGCNQLEAFYVAEGSESFSAVDGVLYNADRSVLILCPDGKTGTVTIDPACKTVSLRSFENRYGVTSIILPEGLETIESTAFAGTGITDITVPESVTSIGESAFQYCSELKTAAVNASVEAPCQYMFSGCTALETVTFGESIHAYSIGLFNGCSALVSAPVIEGVTEIPESCFYGCSSLASFDIPETVTTIGSSAFNGCSSLAEAVLPEGLTSIGMNAFANCSSLTEMTIPAGIDTLPGSLFQFCTALREVTVLGDLTASSNAYCIGGNTFGRCPALEKITFKCPAPDPKKVNSSAFNNSSKNIVIHYPNLYPEWAEIRPVDVGGNKFTYVADRLAPEVELISVELRERPAGDSWRDIRFTAKVTPGETCEVAARYVVFTMPNGYQHTLNCRKVFAEFEDGSYTFTAVVTGIRPEYRDRVISCQAFLDYTGEFTGTYESNVLSASVNCLEGQD